jgi:hypothetical protein
VNDVHGGASRRVAATPLIDGPILPPADDEPEPRHRNINGPALIRVPEWIDAPLGRYYLYFSSHKGDRIELAFADALEGPWTQHSGGVLHLRDTPFLQAPPAPPDGTDTAALDVTRGPDVPSPLDDATLPHIASPDVAIDPATRSLRLYFHGLDAFAMQPTRVAVSRDGLHFEARRELLARPYLRVFRYRELWYGLAMPGVFCRSENGLDAFEHGPRLFVPEMRHAGVWLRGNDLWVFWTRVGDAPERILLSTIDLRGDWSDWRATQPIEVRRPTRAWEGADEPVAASVRSGVDRRVNQLRDPFVYVEDDAAFLVYSVAGESGLAIARLEVS